MKLPLTYDNYIFDLYGTLVDIHTDESDTAIWEKLAMFYGYYGALYEAKELKERYETLVKSSEAELKKKIEKSDADAQFAISYAHEASPEIHIEDVFEKLYEEKGGESGKGAFSAYRSVFQGDEHRIHKALSGHKGDA